MIIILIFDNQLYPYGFLSLLQSQRSVYEQKSLKQISRDKYLFINLCAYHYWRCLFIHDAMFKEQLQKKVQKGGQKSLQVLNCVATPNTVCHHIGLIK